MTNYGRRFDEHHERLRADLLERLPSREELASARRSRVIPFVSGRVRFSYALRTAAAAAVLIFAIGVSLLWGPNGVDSQAVWANAIENAGKAQSVHFRLSTPGTNSKGSSVEMWWRKGGDFRMEFSNGNILTSNGQSRFSYDKQNNRLKTSDYGGPGVEMFLLGELGGLFASEYSISQKLINGSKVVSSSEVVYKGQKCRKILSERQNDLFEYIIDINDSMLYEVKRYRKSQPQDVISHMEVFEVNRDLLDSLFAIEDEGKN